MEGDDTEVGRCGSDNWDNSNSPRVQFEDGASSPDSAFSTRSGLVRGMGERLITVGRVAGQHGMAAWSSGRAPRNCPWPFERNWCSAGATAVRKATACQEKFVDVQYIGVGGTGKPETPSRPVERRLYFQPDPTQHRFATGHSRARASDMKPGLLEKNIKEDV